MVMCWVDRAFGGRLFTVTRKDSIPAWRGRIAYPSETNWYLFCVLQPAIDVKSLYLLLSVKSAINYFNMIVWASVCIYRTSCNFFRVKKFSIPEFNDYAM